MNRLKAKYIFTGAMLLLFLIPILSMAIPAELRNLEDRSSIRSDSVRSDSTPKSRRELRQQRREAERMQKESDRTTAGQQDSALEARIDSLLQLEVSDVKQPAIEGSPYTPQDSLANAHPDTLSQDTTRQKRAKKAFLDDIVHSKNKDSLLYDVKNQTVYIYNEGEVTYQNMSLKGDFMRVNLDTKMVLAYGKNDTVQGEPTVTQPLFTEGSATPYSMDTITYNFNTKKAKIKGVATQQGDGWLIGNDVKKLDDNTTYIRSGKYTTCDQTDHPHFFLSMTKAKMIPGKKVVTGPAYLVLEDVPIYFPLLPEGFFPLNSGPKSGLLMPTFGEDATKGFFLRDLGYYFTLGQHMDLAVRGGIYTLGSWEGSLAMNYVKRYKHTGNLYFNYSHLRLGDKGMPDFQNTSNFQFTWRHQQDPKANPGSTFNASVDFRTSGYNDYSATSLNQALQTQTNSSISYSKSWLGTPFSFSSSMSVSQNSQNGTLSITLPNAVFSVSTFYPFKRKEAVGKPKWYEKISLRYTGKLNSKINAKESDLFTRQTFEDMQYGIQHTIPVSASYMLFNYINFGPTLNYDEKWYFKKTEQVWNPVTNQVETLDPEYGFYRLYNYNFSLQASTTVYGRFEAKKRTRKIQAIRHTLTPTISFSYAPDFSKQKYGFYKTVQSDSLGNTKTYSPFQDGIFGGPTSGQSLNLNVTLSQTLEMKVLSKTDTSGMKKIKLIDEFRIGAFSYNFLADSMRLSNIPLSLRTTVIPNFGITINATLDPYRVSPQGQRYNKLFFPGRIASASTSFGYTFQSRQDRSTPAVNDITSNMMDTNVNPFYDPYGQMDPAQRRILMTQTYYDFSLPWNVGFSYTINYTAQPVNNGTTGYSKNLSQTVSVNGSLTVLPKMGVTFQGGYDFQAKELTPATVTITRDLHCWQMSFVWIPFGRYKSWSFNIGVKASSLADLKYDKSQSMFESMY